MALKTQVEPTDNRILVKLTGTPQVTDSGLVLPEWTEDAGMARVGEIIKLGPGVTKTNPITEDKVWEPGTKIMFVKNAGLPIEFMPGHIMIVQHEIWGVVTGLPDLTDAEESAMKASIASAPFP